MATFLALFGVKEEEEESFFSIKNHIKSKVSPIMPPLNLQVQTIFAKEFVQNLTIDSTIVILPLIM
jgi:hypothetical protein